MSRKLLKLSALLLLLVPIEAVAGQSTTTRIETRPFYGATVTIERGVRVFRPLPYHSRVIINPGGLTPLSLGFEEHRGGHGGYGGYGGYGGGHGYGGDGHGDYRRGYGSYDPSYLPSARGTAARTIHRHKHDAAGPTLRRKPNPASYKPPKSADFPPHGRKH